MSMPLYKSRCAPAVHGRVDVAAVVDADVAVPASDDLTEELWGKEV